MLLEQSDNEPSVHENVSSSEDAPDPCRPSILLKRLTREEINEYLPPAKPTSHRSSSSDSDDEIHIRTRLRKSTLLQTPRSSTKEQRPSRHRAQEVVISYQPPSPVNESSSSDSLPVVDEVISTHDEAMLEDPVVVPMEINSDPTIEANAPPEVEKENSDVHDASSIEEDSTSDRYVDLDEMPESFFSPRPLTEVPSYAHLLVRSSSSSSSVSEGEKDEQSLVKASSSSKTSSLKKKRVLLSSFSSSSSDESDKTLVQFLRIVSVIHLLL